MRAVLLVIAALLTFAAYWSSLRGEFVYDDYNQITKNALIRDASNIPKMMVSDVWSFKGESSQAWSNYWRPTFMLWLTFNYKLFGLDVMGWHVLSILLHIAVCVLGYLLLLRLRVPDTVAAAVTLVFAVHPVHVESVSWASGIPDVLMSGFLFGSLLLFIRWRASRAPMLMVWSLILYAMSLLSKEVAITFPLLYAVTEWGLSEERSASKALRASVPFFIVALVYLCARYAVLHMLRGNATGAPGIASAIATVPLLLVFYIGQCLAPWRLGPNYGLRAVNSENAGLKNLYLPLAALAAAFFVIRPLWKRSAVYAFATAWFLVPLLPALDVRTFHPEQVVHDRYLYLPVFGMALFIAYGVYELFASRRAVAFALAFCFATLALGFQTFRYGPAWGSEVALWEKGVLVDSSSATTYAALSEAYRKATRLDESKAAAERALEIDPSFPFAMGPLAAIEIGRGNIERGRTLLRQAVKILPRYEFAWDQLALSYSSQGDINTAISIFDEAARINPWMRMKVASNVAVLLVGEGRHPEALERLLRVRDDMLKSVRPDDFQGLFYLAELLIEAGRRDEAKTCYQAFVDKAGSGAGGFAIQVAAAKSQLQMLQN